MDKGFERIELLRKIGALATKLNETIRTLRENDDAVSVTVSLFKLILNLILALN